MRPCVRRGECTPSRCYVRPEREFASPSRLHRVEISRRAVGACLLLQDAHEELQRVCQSEPAEPTTIPSIWRRLTEHRRPSTALATARASLIRPAIGPFAAFVSGGIILHPRCSEPVAHAP